MNVFVYLYITVLYYFRLLHKLQYITLKKNYKKNNDNDNDNNNITKPGNI